MFIHAAVLYVSVCHQIAVLPNNGEITKQMTSEKRLTSHAFLQGPPGPPGPPGEQQTHQTNTVLLIQVMESTMIYTRHHQHIPVAALW